MLEKRLSVQREIHHGSGVSGRFLLSDTIAALDELLKEQAGQIKLIYMDPPYMTGERFTMRVRVGAEEWKSGRGTLALESFSDRQDRAAYLAMMREVLTRCRSLLREDGMIFLHVDYRTDAHLRLLCDEIFGEENFLNEIIWAYRSGGRSMRHFSRKHDVILFYAKSEAYDFNVEEVMTVPTEPKSNHMRRHVDPDGRVYRSIRSGGRVYTYYDDEPVVPSDVWTDMSVLQQRDPERTGYDTQKPLVLLERIVRGGSRAGDTVLDPFAGSSTALEAAKRLGRNFIGIDRCPLTLNIARRRLSGARFEICAPDSEGAPLCEAGVLPGVGFYHVTLERFEMEDGVCRRAFEGLDAVDNWSVGMVRGGVYEVHAETLRNKRTPRLRDMLELPVYEGIPAICVNDVTGRSFLYELPVDNIHSAK